jgi:hypothetical protein
MDRQGNLSRASQCIDGLVTPNRYNGAACSYDAAPEWRNVVARLRLRWRA